MTADEGSFCLFGQGIVRGKLPYVDLFNEKPPLEYFVISLFMFVFGPTFDAARLAASVMFGLVAFFVLSRALRSGQGLAIVSLLLANLLLGAITFQGYNADAESVLAVIFCAVTLFEDPVRTPGARSAALVGLLAGLAIFARQSAAAAALLLAISPTLKGRRLWYFAGLALGVAVWVLLAFVMGFGPAMIEDNWLFHFRGSNAGAYLHPTVRRDFSVAVIWMVAVVTAAIAWPGRRLWTVVWLTTLGLPFIFRQDAFRLWPSAAAALALIARAGPTPQSAGPERQGLVCKGMALLAAVQFAMLFAAHPQDFSAQKASARFIAAHAPPHQSIWVGPFSPQLYCLSSRAPASRYYFVLPWTSTAATQKQLVSDLNRNAPEIIALTRDAAFSLDALAPGVKALVAARYHQIGRDDGYTFYALTRR